MTEIFSSSDDIRGGGELPHAQYATFSDPLKLELGGELPGVTVAYETYGELNATKSNAVLICHALSGDSHVAAHDPSDTPGWWDIAVGPGKAIDTDRYFVICPNVLGGCRGATGPGSMNPATGRPWGADFPTITIADMVECQRMLIDRLGIDKLLCVVGGSMGGHQVLTWARRHGNRVKACAAIATSPRLTSQAMAFDIVGRNAILHDHCFHGGQYYGEECKPTIGLAIARMIGHITYLSREAMRDKFEATRYQPRDVATEFEKRFSVGSYLGYQGAKFVERFDANSYMTLSMAMDLFDAGDSKEELAASIGRAEARWLVMSFSSDWLFPPDQSRQIVEALLAARRAVTYCQIASHCGHDAFLLPNEIDTYGELLRAFLANVNGAAVPGVPEAEAGGPSAISIFHPDRTDYDRIAELIPAGASVLDLGCGAGQLLTLLRERGHEKLMGVELDERSVLACARRGLDVIHADLNAGLPQFGEGQFDCVILSQTLQAVLDVPGVLESMLRVGGRCIVSFPNFAYRTLRRMLAEEGRAPEAPGILSHHWYDTPNVRFLSIKDFEQFCQERGYRVHRRVCLDTEAGEEVHEEPNLNADLAIYVISR